MSKLNEAVKAACVNPEFRNRLKANPKVVLEELGFRINDDIDVAIVEDSPKTLNIVLPIDGWAAAPTLSEIDRVQRHPGSGVCDNSHSSAGCCFTDITQGAP